MCPVLRVTQLGLPFDRKMLALFLMKKHSSTSVYYCNCKPKTTKWERETTDRLFITILPYMSRWSMRERVWTVSRLRTKTTDLCWTSSSPGPSDFSLCSTNSAGDSVYVSRSYRGKSLVGLKVIIEIVFE